MDGSKVGVAWTRVAFLSVCLCAFSMWASPVRSQLFDNGFRPVVGVNGAALPGVFGIAVQADGKIVIGGNFTSVANQTRNRIARLNVDGSLDTTFNPALLDDGVTGIVVQPDQRLVIYGPFSQAGAYARRHIARLNADGSVDPTFNPSPVGANPQIDIVVRQPDGRLLVGGAFTSIGGHAHANIARLNVDGGDDRAFNPSTDSIVAAIALQADGKVVIGGMFHQVNGTCCNTSIARLGRDGSYDSSFNVSIDYSVYALAIQADGKILMGGNFLSVDGLPRTCIARLNADATIDQFYDADIYCGQGSSSPGSGHVTSLLLQPDGKAIVGYGGAPNNYFARLNVDGSVDGNYLSRKPFGPNNEVDAIALQPDGSMLVGGQFMSEDDWVAYTVFYDAQPYLVRLNSDGTPQLGRLSPTTSPATALALQPNGQLLLGGFFSDVIDWASIENPDAKRSNIARFNPDHSLDTGFVADANDEVDTIVVQPDGKILVGGNFTMIGGVNRNRIARLNADGSVDTIFDPNADGAIHAIVVLADGSILVGGEFANIGNFSAGGNYHIPNLARLNADGSVDATYYVLPDNYVYALALQADGRVVVGGSFYNIANHARYFIARLLADGGFDTSFDPGEGPNYLVYNLVQQPDGKILMGGYFPDVNSRPELAGLARLNVDGSVDPTFTPYRTGYVWSVVLQADGKIVVAGEFDASATNPVAYLLRMNADGSDDVGFTPNPDNSVYAIMQQPDGKLVASGLFGTIGGQTTRGLAFLNPTTQVTQSLDFDGSNVTWSRSGGAEIVTPWLEFSVNGLLFVPLGPMERVSSGWRYSGYVPPYGQSFYLRARARTMSGQTDNASSLIESVRWLYVANDVIFANGFE